MLVGMEISTENLEQKENKILTKKKSVKSIPVFEFTSLAVAIKEFESKGYNESLIPCFDHFYFGPDKIELYPHEIFFDEIVRFENFSDPDDQAILYAISAPTKKTKGLYSESYGLYHDDLSQAMIERMKFCHDLKKASFYY